MLRDVFILRSKELYGENTLVYSKVPEIINVRDTVTLICKVHGEFKINVSKHLFCNKSCPFCSRKEILKKSRKRWTRDLVIERISENYNNTIVLVSPDNKFNTKNTYEFKCIDCNRIFKCMLSDLLYGKRLGCPHCNKESNILKLVNSHETRKLNIGQGKRSTNITNSSFIDKMTVINSNLDLSKFNYESSNTKSTVICKKCGKEFLSCPHNLLKGEGCPFCNSSKLSNNIVDLLDSMNIEYIQEKTFDWLVYAKNLKLDFYLPKFNLAIECQGIQHFEKVDYFGGEIEFNNIKLRDELKLKLCLSHNIPILYYTNINKYEYFINQKLIKSTNDIENILLFYKLRNFDF